MYPDVSEHWMPSKQARYGARMAVLVLGLIAVVVFGVGASFSMDNKKGGLNLRMGTDPREGTILEPDFGKARMLEPKDEDSSSDGDDDDDEEAKPAPKPKPAPVKRAESAPKAKDAKPAPKAEAKPEPKPRRAEKKRPGAVRRRLAHC